MHCCWLCAHFLYQSGVRCALGRSSSDGDGAVGTVPEPWAGSRAVWAGWGGVVVGAWQPWQLHHELFPNAVPQVVLRKSRAAAICSEPEPWHRAGALLSSSCYVSTYRAVPGEGGLCSSADPFLVSLRKTAALALSRLAVSLWKYLLIKAGS